MFLPTISTQYPLPVPVFEFQISKLFVKHQTAFPFQAHNSPAVNGGVIDIHAAFGQHLLQFTVTDVIFAVPAYRPQDNIALKMPAFEWVKYDNENCYHQIQISESGIKF